MRVVMMAREIARLGTGPDGYSYLLAGAALGRGARRGPGEPAQQRIPAGPGHHGSLCLQAPPFLAAVPVRSPALAGWSPRHDLVLLIEYVHDFPWPAAGAAARSRSGTARR